MLNRNCILSAALLCALCLWVSSGAHADQTAAKAAAKPASAAHPAVAPKLPTAKAIFAQAAAAYAVSKSAVYSATFSYGAPGSKPVVLNVSATQQKPNLLHVEYGTGSVIVGPDKGYIIDGPGKRYAVFDTSDAIPAADTVGAGQKAMPTFDGEAPLIFTKGGELLNRMAFSVVNIGALIYKPQNFDLSKNAPPGALTSHVDLETLHGNQVYRIVQTITQHTESTRIEVCLDKSTFAPAEVSISSGAGGPAGGMHLDFHSFTLSSGAADPALFAYTPTADEAAYTAAAAADNGAPPLIPAGTAAPDFSIQTADGSPVKLSDFAGKVVVIDFWATWCQPCQMSLPLTDKVAADYSAKNVVFLPICSWDSKAKFTPWVNNRKTWTMKFYFDPAGEDQTSSIAASKYSVQGIPTQYVIGKDGKIVTGFVGYDPDTTNLRQALDKALAAQ